MQKDTVLLFLVVLFLVFTTLPAEGKKGVTPYTQFIRAWSHILFIEVLFNNSRISQYMRQQSPHPERPFFLFARRQLFQRVSFVEWELTDLKKYLIDLGITSTGKKKGELVELAVRAQRKYEVLEICDHLDSEVASTSGLIRRASCQPTSQN